METRRLFYEDSHLRAFDATVRACFSTPRGWAAVLDQTCFYPEGGGQGGDSGTLDGVAVMDTHEHDGEIWHVLAAPLAVGSTVRGELDWDARFDRMQQHSGEHILSGLICRRFGVNNVGFHMGAQTVTIDFDGCIPAQALPELEDEANQIVWQDVEILARYPAPEELRALRYRSKKALDWPVRIVEIPGADCCACCGVHVRRTGEAGPIKILSGGGFHEGTRLEIVCGARAWRVLTGAFEQNRLVSQTLSVRQGETAAGAAAIRDQLAAEKYRAVGLARELFAAIAARYAGQENVLHFAPPLAGGELTELAGAIHAAGGGDTAVFSGEGRVWRYCLLGRDLRAKNAALCAALHGRGGGKPGCQMGTVNAAREEIAAFFQSAV